MLKVPNSFHRPVYSHSAYPQLTVTQRKSNLIAHNLFSFQLCRVRFISTEASIIVIWIGEG
jgi:hypothetical protein